MRRITMLVIRIRFEDSALSAQGSPCPLISFLGYFRDLAKPRSGSRGYLLEKNMVDWAHGTHSSAGSILVE